MLINFLEQKQYEKMSKETCGGGGGLRCAFRLYMAFITRGDWDFFFFHRRIQNGSGAHPASYPMGTRGSFPGGKAAAAWSWPLTSI
jgi:hypothetical protein